MMKYQIYAVERQDYLKLIEISENSVKATHDFLPHEEISRLKPLILKEYFNAVLLKCIKNNVGKIIGFLGIADDKIEMLFVSPFAQGQGVGSALCQYAIKYKGVTKVDVNEQNPRAKDFYEKMGFKVLSRSDLDSQGMPYPILHMESKEQIVS